MLICCPNCETSFQVKPDALGTNGRSVRCARGQRVWFAAPEPEPPEIAQPEFTPRGGRTSDQRSAELADALLAEYVPAKDPVLSPRIEPAVADSPPLAPA